MSGSRFDDVQLANGSYPFDDEMVPLRDLAMIPVPPALESWFRERLADGRMHVPRGVPTELRFRSDDRADTAFTVWRPEEGDELYMLAPKSYRTSTG
ncbi:hypothetical protein [Aureimonas jatrophae]|uniref:Uncharacterized protein n=1 Tax=Aureimonas jatrophae TaxID=1166073 RepID=A0A1H0M4K7_9HYPH|nr:hypothetical protein [Aureimonas jatrophae]MBB3952625.1 hypothetical protein [Aureimonas jatrophae]SDO75388.1 hypothetical protein SAMN05192530_11267 [Aureimonas jatrophae]